VVAAAIAMIVRVGWKRQHAQVASGAWVRAPSLYHYFASKDALQGGARPCDSDAPRARPPLPTLALRVSFFLIPTPGPAHVIAHPTVRHWSLRYMPGRTYRRVRTDVSVSGCFPWVPAVYTSRIVDGMTALTIAAAILNENAATTPPQ